MGEGIVSTTTTTTRRPSSLSSFDHGAEESGGQLPRRRYKDTVAEEEEEEDSPQPSKVISLRVQRQGSQSDDQSPEDCVISSSPSYNETMMVERPRHALKSEPSKSKGKLLRRSSSTLSNTTASRKSKHSDRLETDNVSSSTSNKQQQQKDATFKNLPPPRNGEYDVVIPLDSPFLVECTSYNEMAFAGFRRTSRLGGRPGTAERYGFVRHMGDIIVAVGGKLLVREKDQSSKEAFLSWQKNLQDAWCACGESGTAMHVRFRDVYYRGPTCLPREAERKHLKRYIRVLRKEYHSKQGELQELHQFLFAKEQKFEKLVQDDIHWMQERTRELSMLITPKRTADDSSAVAVLSSSMSEIPAHTSSSRRVPITSSVTPSEESPSSVVPSPPPLVSVVEKEQPSPPSLNRPTKPKSNKRSAPPSQTPQGGPPKKRPLSKTMMMHRRVSTEEHAPVVGRSDHGSHKRLRKVPSIAVDETED